MDSPASEYDAPLPALPFAVRTADHVLNFLDGEISRINAEQHRPGWSMWALYGAIASVLWLLLNGWEQGAVHLVSALQLFLVVSLSFEILRGFLMWIKETPRHKERQRRFKFMSDVQNSGTWGWSLARACIILLIVITSTRGVSWGPIAFAVFMQTLTIALSIWTVIRILRDDPVPVEEHFIRKKGIASFIGFGVQALFSIVSLWVVARYFFAAVSRYPEGTSVSDFRTAGLLVVLSFLLSKLVSESKQSPLLGPLVQVQRDLSFGRIDADAAVRRADIILDGMEAEELFQEEISELVDTIELMDWKRQRTIETLYQESPQSQTLLTNDVEVIKSIDRDIKEQLASLNKRIKRFNFYVPGSEDLMLKLLARINTASNESSQNTLQLLESVSEALSIKTTSQ